MYVAVHQYDALNATNCAVLMTVNWKKLNKRGNNKQLTKETLKN